MPVTPRASMKVLGRTQLLEWVNGAVQGDYDKIEDLADGETTDSALPVGPRYDLFPVAAGNSADPTLPRLTPAGMHLVLCRGRLYAATRCCLPEERRFASSEL